MLSTLPWCFCQIGAFSNLQKLVLFSFIISDPHWLFPYKPLRNHIVPLYPRISAIILWCKHLRAGSHECHRDAPDGKGCIELWIGEKELQKPFDCLTCKDLSCCVHRFFPTLRVGVRKSKDVVPRADSIGKKKTAWVGILKFTALVGLRAIFQFLLRYRTRCVRRWFCHFWSLVCQKLQFKIASWYHRRLPCKVHAFYLFPCRDLAMLPGSCPTPIQRRQHN